MASRTSQALLLGIARILGALAFVIASAVLSRSLAKEQYGTFRQCWMLYLLTAPVLTLGLGHSLYYFYPKYGPRGRRLVVTRTITVTLVLGLCTGLTFVAVSDALSGAFSNPLLTDALRAFSLFYVASLPFFLGDAIFVPNGSTLKASLFSVFARLSVVIGLAVPVALLSVSLTTGLLILGLVQGTGTLMFIAVAYWAYPARGASEEHVSLWSQLRYAWPIAAAGVLGSIFIQLDKILMAVHSSPREFAVYSNGALENPLVSIVTAASGVVIASELVHMRDQGRNREFAGLWNRATRKIATVTVPIAAFIFVFAGETVELLFSAKYSESTEIFRYYVLLTPVRIVNFSILFMALNRNGTYMIGHAIACAAGLAVGVFALEFAGSQALVWTVVSLTYLMAISFLFIIAKSLRVRLQELVPWRALGLLLVTSVSIASVVWFAMRLLPGAGNFVRLLVGGAAYTLLCGTVLVLTKQANLSEWPVLRRLGRNG